MKTKTILIASILAFGLLSCNNAGQKKTDQTNTETAEKEETVSVTYLIDEQNSMVNWKGSMIGVYAHTGTIKFFKGSLTLKNEVIIEGSFMADLNSMVATDSDELYKNAPRERLIGHLKSDDFFSTDKFPTAEFKIKNHTGDVVTGDLTVKGITLEETVTNVIISKTNGTISATGNLVFDRQKYNVTYKNKMGDMVISDDIELTISISGKTE